MALPGTIHLLLRVVPRAGREGWGDWRGERLLVYLTAAPVDGKANARLKKFLAVEFGTTQAAVSIERGEHSREKSIRITAPKRIPEVLGTLP